MNDGSKSVKKSEEGEFNLVYEDIMINTEDLYVKINGQKFTPKTSKEKNGVGVLACIIVKQKEGIRYNGRIGLAKSVKDFVSTFKKANRKINAKKKFITDAISAARNLLKRFDSKCEIKPRALSLSVRESLS